MKDLFNDNHLDRLNMDAWQSLIEHLLFVDIRFIGKGAYFALFRTSFGLFFSIEQGNKKGVLIITKLNTSMQVAIMVLDDPNLLAGSICRVVTDADWNN